MHSSPDIGGLHLAALGCGLLDSFDGHKPVRAAVPTFPDAAKRPLSDTRYDFIMVHAGAVL